MGVSENLPDLIKFDKNKYDFKVEMVLNEILQSEKKYVKTLDIIVEVSYHFFSKSIFFFEYYFNNFFFNFKFFF